MLILRIKFYRLLKPLKENKAGQRVSVFIAVIIFFIIVFISWLLFSRLSLGKIEKGGLLLEEDRDAEVESENLEKEYYELQDKVQKEITELIPILNSNEERQDMLFLLSSLIKDTSIVAEVKKAESALINRLKIPGPGLQKAKGDDIAIQIKNYLDRKTQFNLINLKEGIINFLKKNRFNIMDKFSIMNRINKMHSADSNQKIKEFARQLKQIVNNSSAKSNAKRDLRNLIKQLKEWKTFELYRKKMDSLNKKIDSLDGQLLKKEFTDLLSDIDNMENLSDLKEAVNKIEKLKEATPPVHRDMLREMGELLDLKTEMLLSEKAKELKEKVENLNLPGNESQELKEKIDDIKDAQNSQEFLKSLTEYREKAEENRTREDKKIKELLEMKAHLLFNDKKENVKDALKESNLADKRESLIKDLEKLESKKSEELVSDSKKLKEDIEKLSNQGFIPKGLKDNLTKEIEEIKELFQAEMGPEKESERKESPEKAGQADYRDKWEELIEKSSLKKEKKEALKQLGKELSQADTISQVENIKEATYDIIEKLSMDGVKKEEIDKIKETFDAMVEIKRILIIEKSLAALRDKIEDLKRVDPQEAEKIQRSLEKIRTSRTNEELKKEIDALRDYLNSKKQEQGEEKKPEEIKETGNLEINVLPSHLIIPLGSLAPLKAVAVYNKVFIKELGQEPEWFSSEPYVAWVDEKGIVHSLAKGKTQIYATYSGKDSQKIEVTIVDKIDEQVSSVVTSESIR